MNRMFNGFKRIVLSTFVALVLTLSTLTVVNAASYVSGSQSRSVGTNAGSAKVTCIGYYYPSGNTRWSRSWSSSSWSSGLKAVTISSTISIPSDPVMYTTGTATMTNYSYAVGSVSVTLGFRYSSGSVSGI